ncbi:uncharacterized protein [Amphiura filiformis]|uniref:uncharacterized protein n=1 Tax=Amphiura filiformis TaxID=82378 RepID=UPI003B223985
MKMEERQIPPPQLCGYIDNNKVMIPFPPRNPPSTLLPEGFVPEDPRAVLQEVLKMYLQLFKLEDIRHILIPILTNLKDDDPSYVLDDILDYLLDVIFDSPTKESAFGKLGQLIIDHIHFVSFCDPPRPVCLDEAENLLVLHIDSTNHAYRSDLLYWLGIALVDCRE